MIGGGQQLVRTGLGRVDWVGLEGWWRVVEGGGYRVG